MQAIKKVFINDKGQKLIGYLYKNNSKHLLLMCHGTLPFAGYPGMDEVYQLYHSLGTNILTFSFTGYGESEGKPGISIRQRVADIGSILDQLEDQYETITLYGVSLGAIATVIAASKYEKIKRLILINGLYYLKKGLYARQAVQLLTYILLHPISLREVWYWQKNFKPSAIHIPTLIVYGEKDPIINPKQSIILYKMLKNEKELVVIPEGDHSLMKREYMKSAQRLYDWISLKFD